MKYTIIFCVAIVTISPTIYKKDIASSNVPVRSEKCDSIKFNTITEVNTFLGKISPDVKIKAIRTSNK